MEGAAVVEDSPSSLWMIRAAELFPKEEIEKEDNKLQIPFNELPGEHTKYLGKIVNGILALSNYRIYLSNVPRHFEASIPLKIIETVQIKEISTLIINCKDAATYTISFATTECCLDWHSRITLAASIPEQLENLFAFAFHAYISESQFTSIDPDNSWLNRLQHANFDSNECFYRELERMKFDLKGAWRISNINNEFKLCASYPKLLVVPACISDDTLSSVASFRSSRRIPAVVYRHIDNGAIIARSSQPEVGWLGWRNSKDEQLLKALSDACSFDNNVINDVTEMDGNDSTDTSQCEHVELDKPKKILIVDARSYASAVTNRARGGGVECAEYYPSAEIQFMNLANIHVIRKSFQSLRQLCALEMDIPNWYSLLEKTNWLQHISGLISASNIVVHAVVEKNRSILVHCSDGWDRTSQICSTAQICLDPYYRTIEGFRVLVEKEWLSFGHKFGDRCGHGVGSEDINERCPIFLQWLDCIYQLHHQYPCAFEFSTSYLIKLAQHIYSCLFGTFLCNTLKERLENSIPDRTFSVWPFLSVSIYKNPLYQAQREKILWPSHNVRSLVLWNDFYFGSFHTPDHMCRFMDISNGCCENGLTKTRSFSDLLSETKQQKKDCPNRRLSDPSISYDENKMMALTAGRNGHADGNGNGVMEEGTAFCNNFEVKNSKASTTTIKDATTIDKTQQNNFSEMDECDSPTLMQEEKPRPHFKVKNRIPSSNESHFSDLLTPSILPGILDKNLPDGLNHALSHENIRLQQLVLEFKIKEEALQNELQVMRLALLKSNECHCNNGVKQNCADEAQNECNLSEKASSVTSWEAVSEDVKGTSSPWIPDAARKKCKNCQIEFWLGRRRHHCRKCLEIFCADCSDNFAQINQNENIHPPVRLCYNCFSNVEKEEN